MANIFKILSKINLLAIRDSGSARLTIALKGRPFARKIIPSISANSNIEYDGIKLNIGGGKGHPKLEGWKIVDLRETADVVHNIVEDPLPFDDDSVDIIFTSHTLEHIYPQQLDSVLEEFYRVLKSEKSILRILVPDIELGINAYLNKDEQFFYDGDIGLSSRNVPIGGLLASWLYSTRIFKDPNSEGGFGHVHCFDYDYMEFRLRRIGFRKIWKSSFKGSIVPELCSDDFDRHPHDSLCIEAIK